MKLLLVEDDKVSMMILTMLAEKLGHECIGCESGQQALNIIDATFDLVITDWNLPTLSGLELITELQATAAKTVPVILISCMPEQLLKENAEKAGANGFLCKPFSRAKLDATIRQLIF